MKLNWGWALVIALALFAIFIGQFFVRGFSHRADLVADDYYNKEINYQQHINSAANAKALGAISFIPVVGNLGIQFPEAFDGKNATGSIQLYKPDNSDFDQTLPLAIDSANVQVIKSEDMLRGLWRIKIDAKANGESYYWEESINL